MDIAIESDLSFSKADSTEEKGVIEFGSLVEVGDRLRGLVPGVLVVDNDFTLKPKEYELGFGGKEPGRLPEDSIKLLHDLKRLGWQVLVVTNQPREGRQVARFVRKLKGGGYSIFPDSVEEVLGKEGIDGGGSDFLWRKYKSTPEAVEKTVGWIRESVKKAEGRIVFVGDRASDVDFANRVGKELAVKGVDREVSVWKVEGLKIPKKMKFLERLVP